MPCIFILVVGVRCHVEEAWNRKGYTASAHYAVGWWEGEYPEGILPLFVVELD
jgi:hypothetical protein